MAEAPTAQRRMLVVVAQDHRRGAELEGYGLAQALGSARIETDVVALSPATHGQRLGVDVLGSHAAHSPRAWARLRRRASGCDVVVAFGSITLAACAVGLAGTGIPFVYRSIGDPRQWAGTGWRRRRTALLVRRAAAVVALWPAAAADFVGLYGTSRDRVVVIANARTDAFAPATPSERAAARAGLGLHAEASVVAVVASLSDEKRVDLAIDAVARVDDALLVVAGDGPCAMALQRRAEATMRGRHRFLGSVTDVRPVFAAADAVLSTSATEGLPGVLIEAGMCAIPVVATAVGGVPSLFANGLGGIAVGVDTSADDLAAALRALLGEPPRLAPLRGYTWADVLPQWATLIAAVAEGRPLTATVSAVVDRPRP